MAILPLFGQAADSSWNLNAQGQQPLSVSSDAPMAQMATGSTQNAPKPIGFTADNSGSNQADTGQTPPRTQFQTNSQAAAYGMRSAGGVQPDSDVMDNVASAVGSGLQGAMQGGAVGGPEGAFVGGATGLLMGGLNAWLGNRAAQRESDRQNALKKEADRRYQTEVARDEKWRNIYRNDTLEQARYERKKYAMQAAYQAMQDQGKSMMQLAQGNSTLKDNFAKMGWN